MTKEINNENKKPLLPLVHPTHFQVKISNCGSSSLSGSYKIMKEKDALDLLFTVVRLMTNDFVGKDNAPTLRYHLACSLLKDLNLPKTLLTDIENANDLRGKWVHTTKEEAEKCQKDAEEVKNDRK